MQLTWMGLSLLLLPALAVLTSKKFSRMPNHHVNAALLQTVHKNIGSRIQCTALCHLANCLSIDYNEGTCTVHQITLMINEGGSSYIAQGAVDRMLNIPKYPYEEHKEMRYITILDKKYKASETYGACAKLFSFGKRFMAVENTDVAFVKAKYLTVYGGEEKKLWIGLTDSVTEGTSRWDDGRDFVIFPGWTWKSGDGSNDEEKDYVFITVMKGTQEWEAEYKKSDELQDALVCEVTIPAELLPWPCN